MQSKHESIIRSVNNKKGSYSVLCCPTHERYQQVFGQTRHKFVMVHKPGTTKPWVDTYAPMPKNHIIVDLDSTPNFVRFDLALSQDFFSQNPIIGSICYQGKIPLINLQHTWPGDNIPKETREKITKLAANKFVFISEQSANAWGFSVNDPNVQVIRHGIDTTFWSPDNSDRTQDVCVVANDYKNRDYFLGYKHFEHLRNLFNIKVLGDTPGLSVSAPPEGLKTLYNNSLVYLNTSTRSPIPMSLLEACSMGCVPVALNNCAIPDLIENEVNGFLCLTQEEMKDRIEWCLKNREEAKAMGALARKTVEDQFGFDRHLNEWNILLEEVYGQQCDTP